MAFELIATFIVAIAAAGVVMLVNRVTGGRLPRWSLPVAAGLAMISFTIWNEYSWGARTTLGLPDGLQVVTTVESSAPWKPWTYLVPQVTRLAAVDTQSVRRNADMPELRLAELYLFGRWQAPGKVELIIDCAAGARSDATPAVLADPVAADWITIGKEDPLIRAACDTTG